VITKHIHVFSLFFFSGFKIDIEISTTRKRFEMKFSIIIFIQ